jgi:hypothetical protein
VTIQVSVTDDVNTRTADCGATSHAVGGGGRSTDANDQLVSTFPSNVAGAPVTGTNPRYWTAVWESSQGNHTAFALCVPN